VDISKMSSLATIPVFDSADKSGIMVYFANSATGTCLCDVVVAELEGSF
jgi:hypothetical protein